MDSFNLNIESGGDTQKPPFKVGYQDLCKGVARKDVIKEMFKSDSSNSSYRKFVKCRQSYYVGQCNRCGDIDISGSRCESKICPECGEKRLNKLIATNTKFLNALPTNPRGQKRATLLTLTIKNVPDSEYGRHDYKRLAGYFKDFLKHPKIKSHIRGGLYAIETKRPLEGYVYRTGYKIAPGRTWNLHIHALVDMDFIAWQVVRGVWKGISGGIDTDMRAVNASVPALIEVLKYAVKPPNLGDAKSYVRYLEVTKNLRLYNTFGTFYGHFQLSKKIHGKYQKKCLKCPGHMLYCFEIGLKEALRYKQLLEGGPPRDIYGKATSEFGLPETALRLRTLSPFFKNALGFKEKSVGVGSV